MGTLFGPGKAGYNIKLFPGWIRKAPNNRWELCKINANYSQP